MDDQGPLNPLLGSIFPTSPTQETAVGEGGQLQAQVSPLGFKLPVLQEPAHVPAQATDEVVLVWKRLSPCGTAMFHGEPPPGACCNDVQVEMSRSEAEAGGYKVIETKK